MQPEILNQIRWLGHGSFLIEGPPFIYIDPWRVRRGAFHADLILVSHEHYDHCSIADVARLRGEQTVVMGNETVTDHLPDVTIVRPWYSYTHDDASIKVLPAYSADGIEHPQQAGGLGFVISLHLYDIYYAGDTGLIPEMAMISPDIALLPIDGKGTLSVDDAVKAVDILRPKWVFPYNWGDLTGEGVSRQEALAFQREVGRDAQVILPQLT